MSPCPEHTAGCKVDAEQQRHLRRRTSLNLTSVGTCGRGTSLDQTDHRAPRAPLQPSRMTELSEENSFPSAVANCLSQVTKDSRTFAAIPIRVAVDGLALDKQLLLNEIARGLETQECHAKLGLDWRVTAEA